MGGIGLSSLNLNRTPPTHTHTHTHTDTHTPAHTQTNIYICTEQKKYTYMQHNYAAHNTRYNTTPHTHTEHNLHTILHNIDITIHINLNTGTLHTICTHIVLICTMNKYI